MLAHQELIAPMNSTELRKAMDGQAQKVGLRFELDLSNTILDDVRGEPGAMPLLQHTLLELWKCRHGRWLRAQEYRGIGGVQQAIARTADDAYSQLTPDNQERVRDIFVRLTRLDEEVLRGEERRDTRRRVAILELVPAGSDPGITRAMVKRLADDRLVVTSVNKATGTEEVEVAHEALIRYWPRLHEWIDEDRKMLRLREGVSRAAREWEDNGREESYLAHREDRLKRVEMLISHPRMKLSRLEQAYFDACRTLGIREKGNLARSGWGVIFSQDSDPVVREALHDLLAHRRQQAAQKQPDYYHEFSGDRGYRKDESRREFLTRHGVGSGPSDPGKMPHYLLLVGDPESIPYSFQYELGQQYAVGRISFESHEEYAAYARSVVKAESGLFSLPRHAVVFAPLWADDHAMQIAHEKFVQPLIENLTQNLPNWSVEPVLADAATKDRLGQVLAGRQTRALLLAASHGIGFPSGHADQLKHQGALLCQDWPGPKALEGKGDIREFCFSGNDISEDSSLLGMVAFLFTEYGAGTPQISDFFYPGQKEGNQEARRAFVARLPQRLLSHSRGGALAVIAHVGITWTCSFTGELGELAVFSAALKQLMEGYPVGTAMQHFTRRYLALLSELSTSQQGAMTGEVEARELMEIRTATYDARNWVLIGDPAVRLILEDGKKD